MPTTSLVPTEPRVRGKRPCPSPSHERICSVRFAVVKRILPLWQKRIRAVSVTPLTRFGEHRDWPCRRVCLQPKGAWKTSQAALASNFAEQAGNASAGNRPSPSPLVSASAGAAQAQGSAVERSRSTPAPQRRTAVTALADLKLSAAEQAALRRQGSASAE